MTRLVLYAVLRSCDSGNDLIVHEGCVRDVRTFFFLYLFLILSMKWMLLFCYQNDLFKLDVHHACVSVCVCASHKELKHNVNTIHNIELNEMFVNVCVRKWAGSSFVYVFCFCFFKFLRTSDNIPFQRRVNCSRIVRNELFSFYYFIFYCIQL